MSGMTTKTIFLNADIGESFGPWQMGADELIMPHIDWANVACGFHASDPLTMSTTVKLAKQHGVRIGAHPAYPDLVGFGRRHMACKPEEITALVQYQVGALQAIAQGHGGSVHYVKPHGALYNDMLSDGATFDAVCKAIKALQNNRAHALPLMIMATPDNDAWQSRAEEFGVQLLFEGFADRAYDDDGRIRSRRYDDAVYGADEDIVEQARRFSCGDSIISVGGFPLDIKIDSLCVHGDSPNAISTIKKLRELLTDSGCANA
ncbi:MAG TPA: LamB/YcsF family protein [Idiomarina sp.]|nr:LamB/YcsF family protein [Idiomarina sp.]